MEAPNSPPSDSNTSPTVPKKPWSSPHRTRIFWIIILIIVVYIGMNRQNDALKQKTAQKGPPAQVVLASANTKNIPVYIAALGNVTPTYSVTVKAQVNGTLLRVLYTEGQIVKTGDLLAEIDPRPYEAQLVQYEGQLKRDAALLANAKVDLQRYQKLWRQDSVSQQVLATQASLVQQYEGAVKTDQGLIESTKVNLIYTRITSPINGRVGLRLVDPGNLIQTTDTSGLMIINTLDPITVIFTIPQDNIPEVAKLVYDGNVLMVESYDRDQNTLLSTGKLLTIDNQVDPTTGTVKLRAQFPNSDNRLFPGQFVNIKLLVKTLANAVVIPTAAIQYNSSKEPFIYLLKNNLTVMAKPVKIGVMAGDNTSISTGLLPKQLVIVEGGDKLTNGTKVNVAPISQSLLQPALKAKLNEKTQFSLWRLFL